MTTGGPWVRPPRGHAPGLLVIATFYPLYEFARQVGGDGVEVAALVPSGVEPHHWEPTPSELAHLQRARVFVYNGAGLEPWVDRLLGETLSKETIAGGAIALAALLLFAAISLFARRGRIGR